MWSVSKKYNYTGICYNIDDFKTITDVAVNSPAYKAGIRGGMVVNKIDDKKFNSSKNEILNGYKRFITETMKYRNPGTRFTDANGFPDCMYWNTKDYKEVSKAFDNDIYVTVFDYLYNFEKYVSSKSNQTITVETKSNKYRVIPEIKEEVSIRAY
ncbi:MAG: hypothetical protein ACLVKO_06560 [Dysgonomonas sp.]